MITSSHFSVRGRPWEVHTTTDGGVLRLFAPLEFSEDCLRRPIELPTCGRNHQTEHVMRTNRRKLVTSPLRAAIGGGFHRVHAAKRKGLQRISAIFFDGSLEPAFIVAVEANVTHGLPLSIGDRRAAVATILQTHSDWSDRAIAASTGLSAKTVSAIRCANAENPQLNKHLGRDGQVRPLNAGVGGQHAAQLLASRPNASLREIAKAAGISPGTVRDVRERLKRGEDVVPTPRCQNRIAARGGRRKQSAAAATNTDVPADVKPVLVSLSRDPALRMSEAGRELLRWLHFHAVSSSELTRIAESIPDHCADRLVELANRCAANWAWIADDLSKRTQDMHTAGAASSAKRRNIAPPKRTA